MSKVNTAEHEAQQTVSVEAPVESAAVSKANRFNGICDYKKINGDVCGKRCLRETRCAQHKDMESYTNKCKVDECPRMTNSAYGFCSQHANYKKDAKRPEHSDEVKELALKLKELGMSASIRKAPIKKVPLVESAK